MPGYRGAASVGSKTISGKRYSLWGWLTVKDKREGRIVEKLRQTYKSVRVLGKDAPFAVWIRR